MDMTITINKSNKIETTLFEKKLNLHLYIPPHSAHPLGLLPGIVYSTLFQIFTLCSSDKDKVVEFWGLPPLILFFNMSIGWFGRFVLSTECYRTRKLGYKNLNWPRCSAQVTESLALTDGSFCRKQNTLYFRLCKTCEFMMCILIVDHHFNRIHPWCSWECMLP